MSGVWCVTLILKMMGLISSLVCDPDSENDGPDFELGV